MGTATVTFLVIGGIGVLLLVVGLLGGELFDLDGFLSLESVAAMLGGFGFAAAIASLALDARTTPALLASAGLGVVAAVPAGLIAVRIAASASRMPTDATPTRGDLPGTMGVVVTPVPAAGYGEVRVMLGGQPVKLNARADTAIPLGARVFVVTALSDTSVVVEPLPASSGTPPAQ